MDKIGKWTFVGGFVLAVAAGLGVQAPWLPWVLAVLGLVVGILNVTGEESRGFLIAAIGLMLSATAVQSIPYAGELVTRVLSNVIAFIAAAALVVSLKAVFETARD